MELFMVKTLVELNSLPTLLRLYGECINGGNFKGIYLNSYQHRTILQDMAALKEIEKKITTGQINHFTTAMESMPVIDRLYSNLVDFLESEELI